MAEPGAKPALHPALAEVLRANRESFNQRFAARIRSGAQIDEAAFQEHLRTTVNELAGFVAKVQPERVRAVVESLFDASLDLFAAGLLGPESKHKWVPTAWREVLPHAVPLLARDPARVVGSLSNAIDHVAGFASARPFDWIAGMRKLSPRCDSVSQWLDGGKVLAWRAGLVQYRQAALKIARSLPWKLSACCFDAPEDLLELAWRDQLDKLEIDCWYAPLTGRKDGGTLRIVRITGDFRGFGGLCLRPPTVSATDAGIFVMDGQETWQLLADAFGTLWHRMPQSSGKKKTSQAAIDPRGKVTWDGTQKFDELAEASSYACDGQTLAVTLPTSYHVFLVARA